MSHIQVHYRRDSVNQCPTTSDRAFHDGSHSIIQATINRANLHNQTRSLRLRLAYAAYKVAHGLTLAPFFELEAGARDNRCLKAAHIPSLPKSIRGAHVTRDLYSSLLDSPPNYASARTRSTVSARLRSSRRSKPDSGLAKRKTALSESASDHQHKRRKELEDTSLSHRDTDLEQDRNATAILEDLQRTARSKAGVSCSVPSAALSTFHASALNSSPHVQALPNDHHIANSTIRELSSADQEAVELLIHFHQYRPVSEKSHTLYDVHDVTSTDQSKPEVKGRSTGTLFVWRDLPTYNQPWPWAMNMIIWWYYNQLEKTECHTGTFPPADISATTTAQGALERFSHGNEPLAAWRSRVSFFPSTHIHPQFRFNSSAVVRDLQIFNHSSNINCIAFNRDGSIFAVGAHDGSLRIFSVDGSRAHRYYQGDWSLQALVWAEQVGAPNVLIAGDCSGDIHTIRMGTDDRQFMEHVPGCVHAMAARGPLLAISCSSVVYLIQRGAVASWDSKRTLPSPPPFPGLLGQLSPPLAGSMQFLSDDIVIIAYVEHGIAGYSTISRDIIWQIRPRTCYIGAAHLAPDGAKLVVTNLYDGLDYYSTQTRFGASSTHQFSHNTPSIIDRKNNVVLPVKYIHDGAAVLVGGTEGSARILSTVSGESLQTLGHHDGIVQALDYCFDGANHWVVTAISESSRPVVRIWKARADDRLLSTAERIRLWFLFCAEVASNILRRLSRRLRDLLPLGLFMLVATAVWYHHSLLKWTVSFLQSTAAFIDHTFGEGAKRGEGDSPSHTIGGLWAKATELTSRRERTPSQWVFTRQHEHL
ncbi:WD40-repeat-containing domain protein [Vararia minispora EC-137]|uniref:WD40-repeat-containing domain protein n=1 Tax=Vararia minispora EC-137 TaxID=1314806 RepID=A0ACB8QA36_9AGAM|nr:WD40-repeat-containing domain protein [Vararia minispora EC-137]